MSEQELIEAYAEKKGVDISVAKDAFEVMGAEWVEEKLKY